MLLRNSMCRYTIWREISELMQVGNFIRIHMSIWIAMECQNKFPPSGAMSVA